MEPLDLEELKQRLRVQIDQELHAVATGGELIEKLHNIEREVAENYSVPSFEDLRHGSFVAFLDANRDMLANISVGSARGAGEGAQDPLFSRIPAPEELAEYVAQYTAHHHDTKVVDKVVHSVMAQFDVPARCFKSVYAKVSAALETLSSSESQAATVATATTTTKHVNRQYLRAYIGDSTFSAWTPEKAVEFPLDSDVPPMVDALTWGRIAKRQNVASLDASGALNESDLVFLDNGIAVKRTEGKGLCRAVAECDPWGAVSEIVSLVVSNDGRLPVELCSQQCASGFAAMKLSPFRFLLDFLKLLPPVFYETADGLIKSVVVDPFVGAFGRLETAFFALVADPGDRAYAKSALSLLGVDVTGFADKPSICTGAAAAAVAGIPSGVQLSNSVSSGGFDDEEDVTAVAVPVQNSRGAISVGVSASGNGVNSGATGFGAGTPEAVIDDIRRNEFGIGVETDERTQRTLKAQYEREARAIERLSSELYTQDAHFFLELLQNADDNKYPAEPGLCPTLELEFTPAALIVRNNEIGFSERDVRAICDIANSTKSSSKRAEAGQTGEKGIGFKAVFRVSDRPQIHSNGYHFEFDADSAPVKFIVPRWIGGGNSCSCGYALQDPGTTIVLPWRKDVAHKAGALFNRMASVNAESLLFLRRLAKIVVKNAASGEVRAISREVHPLPPPKCGSGCVTASVVRMRVGEGKEEKEEAVEGGSWLVVEKKLFPQVTRRGATVRQTALSLGFRLAKDQSALADEFCSVCALLPLCASRFRFIVQGDFVSSASREGLDEDVAWNQWLRSEVPDVFVHAVEAEFLTSPAATSENLRYTWYAFVPTPRDGTGLFASVPTEILRKLSAIECVLSEDGRNVLPKKALLVPDAVRSLFPQSAVDAVFGSSLRYCHPRVSASAPAVLQLLGAQTFGVSHLVALLSKLPALPVPKDDAWFRALFGFLCDYVEPVLLKDSASETAFYDGLRSAPFLPTESPSGELGDPSSVFVMKHNEDYLAADPDAEEEKAGESAAQDVDSRMVRFSVLRSLDPVLRSKALALLQRLGVRTYSEHEHVLRHVLPALPELDNEEAILAKTRIVYKHWKSCSICLSDNRSLSRKLHNGLPILLLPPSTSSSLSLPTKKFCFLKDACVHFRPRFRAGPASALWNVLSGAYPAQWREFFEFVGVRDSLCVLPEQNVLSLDGPSALWHGVALPPASSHSYSVEDFVCPEFSSLVSGIKALPQSDAHGAMEELAHLCEDDWLVLSKCLAATVRYCDPATGAELSQQVPSSFLATLRSTKWVLSGERAVTITTTASSGSSSSGSSSNEASRFRAPSTLFADNPECATFVGVIGPYPKVPLSESFAREIGVRFAVGPDDALGLLLRWAKAGETRQTREQMESVYKKAAESPSFKDAAAHHGRPLVFDPKGKRYVSPGQAFWDDPSERFVSLVDAGYAQDMKAVFVDCLCVPEHPEPDAYVRMLADLAGTPSESAARAAFGVFAHFGRLIEEGALEDTDPRWRKLGKMVVFPTTDFHWLSARDHIYINDCKSFRSPLPVRGGITYMYVPPEHRLLSQGISFAAMLGVRCISEALSLRSIVDAPEPDSELLEFVRDNILYVQRFVKKRYPDIYASLGQEFAAALAGFRVFTASRISGVWCIDGDRETNPIPYDALLDGNTLYYRRAKKVHRYDRCVLNELSKFFLGNTHDTTVMVAFFGTLARDSDNENFGAEMEKYIGPELGDTEERWVVRFEDDKEVTPEPMFVEDAARIGEPEVTTNNNNNNNSSIVVSVPASHDSSTTVDNGTITAAATTAATVTTPTVVPEHVVVAAAGRPLNTLDDEEKRTIGVRGEEIVFEALKSQHPHDTVVWCNEESETGFPYDLVVSDANGKNKRYIEVKATKTLDKPFFEVSFREWMFSQEHRDRFFIYRVFGALSDAPRVLRIQNPFKEWSLGNLGMLLSIKNTTSSN